MEGTEDLRHIQQLLESSPSPLPSPSLPISPRSADHRVLRSGKVVTDHHQIHQHQAQAGHDLLPARGVTDNPYSVDEKHDGTGPAPDPVASLKRLLDRIPITPLLDGGGDGDSAAESRRRVPGGGGMLDLDPELELKQEDTVCQAIEILHRNCVQGAPFVDDHDPAVSMTSLTGGFRDQELGFLHLSALLLWCLEEMNKACLEFGSPVCSTGNFLQALQQQAPTVAQTKMIELASRSSMLWEPFFPVSPEETLLHVLLLLAKHPRLSVVPVTQQKSFSSSHRTIGYISQKAVVQLLLQSSGLDWFDQIADKRLSDFRFRDTRRSVTCIYGEQSVADGFHTLWTNEADALPIVAEGDKGRTKLIGSLTRNHVLLLLEDDSLFNNRRKTTVSDLMALTEKRNSSLSSGEQQTKSRTKKLPIPCSVATNRCSESLKQAMRNMVSKDTSVSFLVENVDGGHEVVVGCCTLKDAIVQFAPPSSDTSVAGFDFFDSALEDTGCCVQNGVMVCESGAQRVQ